MVRLEPMPRAHELAAWYPRQYWFAPEPSLAGRLEELYRRLMIRDHVRFVRRAWRDAGATGAVLDVGCGGGLFAGMLREQGIAALGLDNSREAAALAWHYHHVPVVCGDLSHTPLQAGSCSVVTMFHVVEHLPDPYVYLRAVRELLHPKGRLVVQVPNLDSWQFRVLGRRWNGIDVPRHLNDFRARDLAKLLSACGFSVVRTKQFSWRDNPAGLATSLAPGLDPMARRVRGRGSSLVKDAAYLALVLASAPLAMLEAAFGAGSTVMVEARIAS